MYKIYSRIPYMINNEPITIFTASMIVISHLFVGVLAHRFVNNKLEYHILERIMWYDIEKVEILDPNLNLINTLTAEDLFSQDLFNHTNYGTDY